MSRLISDLLPEVQPLCISLLDEAENAGIPIMVTQTLRTPAEQDALYAQGRTTPGKIVTHAKAYESWHNFGRAFDVVFTRGTGVTWDGPWGQLMDMAEAIGLECGGRWPAPKTDLDHFEYHPGLTLLEAQAAISDSQKSSDGVPSLNVKGV